jgi:hypothetical protein
MFRPFFAITAIALTTAPAAAASYSATLARPTTVRFIARDISWSCGPAACQGATDLSRPVVLCQSLAKRAGRVNGFLTDGRALSAAELESCNAHAATASASAIAAK